MCRGETRRVSLGNAGRQRHAGRAAATHCWNPRRKLLLKCSNVGNRASIEMGETNELGANRLRARLRSEQRVGFTNALAVVGWRPIVEIWMKQVRMGRRN